ncbi:MAG: B12-binding domain-containing radical SAM protein [Alphaproteobacteria bacterium]
MAHIVLIQPISGDIDEMSIRLPEGLLAIAALPVYKGYDVQIIDQRTSINFKRDLHDAIDEDTVIIGITCMTGQQIGFAVEISKDIKARYPEIPTCWGGVHATLLPEETAEHPAIDYVIVGDGDLVFCELFERLRDKQSIEDLRGLIFKSETGEMQNNAGEVELKFNPAKTGYKVVRKNGRADVIRDLDSLPDVPYQLIDFDDYGIFNTDDGRRSSTLNTTRGCPYRCKFCSDPVLNEGVWRAFTPERIIEKLNTLYSEHDVHWIYFQDDYFPGSKPRLLDLLKRMAHFKRDLKWSTCGMRADILSRLDEDEMKILWDSGCHSLEIGVESGNERVIKALAKAETLDQIRDANNMLAKTDIKVKYSFIIGFPDETDEEILDSIRFATELEKANPNAFCFIFNFTPIIGTPYYYDAIDAGFKEPKSLEEWGSLDFFNWMKKYSSWHTPEKIKWLECISFVSYFHNKNVIFKLGGSSLLRFCYYAYYPLAKWRFEKQKFGFFFEGFLRDMILASRGNTRKFKNAWARITEPLRAPKLAQKR